MKLDRLPYDAGTVLDFYEEGLTALGALCERTWHDRLEVVAERQAAALWNADGSLHSGELHFVAADTSRARVAEREIFPGCPLTFRLTEALRPAPLSLERLVLAADSRARPPESPVAEKLWQHQFPDTTRWRMTAPFKADFHFTLIVLVRCEIQAIDQHWSLRRIAVSLPGGELDENLAHEIAFAQADTSASGIVWPKADPSGWSTLLQPALLQDLAPELGGIRERQEKSLRRELDRIDEYFENYGHELTARASRGSNEKSKLKSADRLAAAHAEHTRRRADQVSRHEIRVRPHFDALLLVAEPAWRATLEIHKARHPETIDALFVPRARRWFHT